MRCQHGLGACSARPTEFAAPDSQNCLCCALAVRSSRSDMLHPPLLARHWTRACLHSDRPVHLGLRGAISGRPYSCSSLRLTRPLAHHAAKVEALLELHVSGGLADRFRDVECGGSWEQRGLWYETVCGYGDLCTDTGTRGEEGAGDRRHGMRGIQHRQITWAHGHLAAPHRQARCERTRRKPPRTTCGDLYLWAAICTQRCTASGIQEMVRV
jgi:hypothetical protein